MFKTLRNITVTLLASLSGCSEMPPSVADSSDAASKPLTGLQGESTINSLLEQLFRSHGLDATIRDGWVLIDDYPAICGAVDRDIASSPNSKAVQIDIFLRVGPDRILVESFGGFGETEDAAIADGFQSFVTNSFHVLLAAFYRGEDDQVETEYWNINGQSRRVTIGRINSRGLPPNYDEPPTEWFNTLAEQIETSALPGGTHWVRCFYGQYQLEQSAIEVLLDNDEWVDAQTEMAKVDWPKCEDYYSVRVFLIIQDDED